MRKPFVYIILAIVAVVALVMFVMIPSMPKETKEVPETEVAVSTGQDTEETAAPEPSKTDIDESVQDTEKPSETDINAVQDTDKPNETDTQKSSEQSKYIGRQIENYVEPQTEDLYLRLYEFQLEYRDTYQSNIVIVPEDIAHIDIDGYEWFDYDPKPTNAFHRTAQFVCYAIFTYYDGKVPCNYYANFDYGEKMVDIHNGHKQSSMIYEVQTHGEKPLNICLDTYNYKIRVEEGIKKKNPDCKLGCCNQ